jgi:predicted negative regulator of RcsB-dependent stress response
MAYDLEEQEQLAELKAFWNKFGNMITWLLIIVLGAYSGYKYWNYYQANQASAASSLYEDIAKAIAAKDNAKVQRIASDLESKYGSTAYAPMGALVAAKSAFDSNDLKTAKAKLAWIIEHGNAEYKSIAKLRMAGVLLDEKAYDEAHKVLATEFLPQFLGAVSDRKGDVLVAQNKIADARTAYQAALDAMDEKNPGRNLVQLKLDAIGGSTKAAPKAAA